MAPLYNPYLAHLKRNADHEKQRPRRITLGPRDIDSWVVALLETAINEAFHMPIKRGEPLVTGKRALPTRAAADRAPNTTSLLTG